MKTAVVALMAAQGGVASLAQLTAVAGVTRHAVDALVRADVLVRVRRGAFVLAEAFAAAQTDWDRAALVVRAVGQGLAWAPGGAHALSHESALMVQGLRHHGADGLVHLVRTDGRAGRRDRTVFVHSPVDPDQVIDVDGLRVVRPALAALQVAAHHGVEAGVVCLDAVLEAAELADLQQTAGRHGPRRAEVAAELQAGVDTGFGVMSARVRAAVDVADGRSQSVGESRARLLVQHLGLGPCTPQFAVDLGGRTVFADLKLAGHDVLLEFDGKGKYAAPGALLAEKLREDALRELGYEVVRLSWADLERPWLVRQKILAAIARATARRAAGAGAV